MKLLIASDIHGSAYYCKKLIKLFEQEKADKLILLGDILYHGPRNDLPLEYAPKQVITMLNDIKDKILCIRGNCDTEVDQMVLDFPILADYGVMFVNDRLIYMTHGHTYNPDNLPPLQAGDVLMCGHTHVPKFVKYDNFIYINPGSVSIPKENSEHSVIIYENNVFSFCDLDGNEYMSHTL